MAQTNVQAFSGDVDISSNLAVSGSKFTYDNSNTTVFTGTAEAEANEIGYLDMSTSSSSNNIHVKVYIKYGQSSTLGEAEYSFYIRPNAANDSLIYDYKNQIGPITPVVYRTNATDLYSGGTPGVVRFGYSIAACQNVIWRVEVQQRSGNVTFYPTNTGSAMVTTGLVQVTPTPYTRIDSNVNVGDGDLFVDTESGNVGIGTTNPETTLDIVNSVSTTNTPVTGLTLQSTTSGTATDGFGTKMEFRAERGDGSVQTDCGTIDVSGRNLAGTDRWDMRFNVRNDDAIETLLNLQSGRGVRTFQGLRAESTDDHNTTARFFPVNGEFPDHTLSLLYQNTRSNGTGPGINFSGSYHATSAFMTTYGTIKCAAGGLTNGVVGHDANFRFYLNDIANNGIREVFTIMGNTGNVGIGSTNPTATLDVKDVISIKNYEDTGFSNVIALSIQAKSSDYTSITNGYGSKIQFRTNRGTNADGSAASAEIKGYVWSGGGSGVDYHALDLDVYGDNSSFNKGISILSESNTGGPARTIMHGNVGIGRTDPGARLHVTSGSGDSITTFQVKEGGEIYIARNHIQSPYISTTMSSGRPGINFGNSTKWTIIKFGNNLDFDYEGDTKGYLLPTSSGELNFTGQHRTFIKDVPFTRAEELEGLIVSSDQNKYIKMSGGIEAGSNAITTNESLPVVSLSNVVTDKRCFGVISASEDPDQRSDVYGSFVTPFEKELGDTRVYINSVGEGAIWVTNTNGSLESGDYITTSNVVGYGQKQDSDSLKNYTVAKITMDCDFEPATQPVQTIKKELQDVNHWVKTTYENVTEEEYSNLTEENRRTITETVFANEDGEIFPEQNEQSTYSELEQTIYQKITKEVSKTEQEGYELEIHQELVNVLDEHGQIQWEYDPSGATEKAYKIRYLDADGNITDEANHVYKAAFVGCTYHCG